MHNAHRDCKAHPDEKGIETDTGFADPVPMETIARPIPTKRELKPSNPEGIPDLDLSIARPIPTKRELKRTKGTTKRRVAGLQGPSRRKGN